MSLIGHVRWLLVNDVANRRLVHLREQTPGLNYKKSRQSVLDLQWRSWENFGNLYIYINNIPGGPLSLEILNSNWHQVFNASTKVIFDKLIKLTDSVSVTDFVILMTNNTIRHEFSESINKFDLKKNIANV